MSKSFSIQLKPPECSQCKSISEYYCRTCKQDLCVPCTEEHGIDFDTIYHDVVIDRLKYGEIMLLKTCERHQNVKCKMWCLMCEFPICSFCVEHIAHASKEITSLYETRKEQSTERIFHIRSVTMLHIRGFQAEITSDFKSCQTEIQKLEKKIIIKAEKFKDRIDIYVEDIKKLNHFLKSKCKQKRRHIVSLQNYVHIVEQRANKAVSYLRFLKKTNLPEMKTALGMLTVKHHSSENEINNYIVNKYLGEIHIKGARKRQARNKQLLKVMPTPVLYKYFTVKPTLYLEKSSIHISCVTSDYVWISGLRGLFQTNTTGNSLLFIKNKCHYYGVHTVTKKGNLIYIDQEYNISTISPNNKTRSTLMRLSVPWRPYCIFCSPFNEDLLIGMMRYDTKTAKVGRYSKRGQELQHDPGWELYVNPRYITENQNGDVIISDLINEISHLGVIVVTDCKGIHRFSYSGIKPGSAFKPRGICTDALSHILVCDIYTKTVQMIDKDGLFLAVLLTEEQGIGNPCSLSYDNKSHLLWVGSLQNTKICIYRHLQRK